MDETFVLKFIRELTRRKGKWLHKLSTICALHPLLVLVVPWTTLRLTTAQSYTERSPAIGLPMRLRSRPYGLSPDRRPPVGYDALVLRAVAPYSLVVSLRPRCYLRL